MAFRLRILPVLITFLACLFPPLLEAQGCHGPVDQSAHRPVQPTVSVAELRLPPKAWAHYDKARAALIAKRRDLFEREAQATLAIAPDFALIYVLRALLQFSDHDYEAVLRTIAIARGLQPELPYSSVIVAGALNALHRFNEAAAELDRFRSLNLTWQWEFERARVEVGRGRVEEALYWSERTLEDAPSGCVDVHLLRANALQTAGRAREAIAEMNVHLASGPNLPYEKEVMQVIERARRGLEQSEEETASR